MRSTHRAKFRTPALLITALLWLCASPAAAAPGDLDPSFSGDGFSFSAISPEELGTASGAIATQPDGKVLVGLVLGKSCHICAPYYTEYLARLNTDGSLDRTFGSDGFVQLRPLFSGENGAGIDIAVQADGSIVLGLAGGPEGGFHVVRLLADGHPDPSFGGGDGAFSGGAESLSAATIGLTGDQRIIVIGSDVRGELDANVVIARLRSDGTLDPTFSQDGWLVEPMEAHLEAGTPIGDQGETLVLADPIDDKGQVAFRYRSDGSRDPSFGQAGVSRIDTDLRSVGDVEVDALGRATFTAIGAGNYGAPFVGRIDRLGALDADFGGDGTVRLDARESLVNRNALSFGELALDASGRPLVAAQDRGVIVGRLTESGEMDASFSGDGWSENHARRGLFSERPVLDLAVAGEEIFVGAASVRPRGEDRLRGGVAALNYSLAAGGAGRFDTDADGARNSRDRCPMLFRDCPRFRVDVDAWYRRSANTIRGYSFSSEPTCLTRRVLLRRRRRGPDRRIGTDLPSGFEFRFALDKAARGDVYAVARKLRFGYGVCPRSRSKRIEIR